METGLSKMLHIHSVPVVGVLRLEKLSSSQIPLEKVVLWPYCYPVRRTWSNMSNTELLLHCFLLNCCRNPRRKYFLQLFFLFADLKWTPIKSDLGSTNIHLSESFQYEETKFFILTYANTCCYWNQLNSAEKQCIKYIRSVEV